MVLLTAAERRSPFPVAIAPVRFARPDLDPTPAVRGASGPAPDLRLHRAVPRLRPGARAQVRVSPGVPAQADLGVDALLVVRLQLLHWAFRISSGVSEGVHHSVVQSDGELLRVGVAGRQ